MRVGGQGRNQESALIIVSVKVSIWFRVSSGVGIGFRIMGQRSGSGVKSQDQGRIKGQDQWSRVRIGGRVMDRVQSQGKGQGQGQNSGSGSYSGPECRVRGTIRGQESKAKAIPRARVQGQDKGKGQESGSGVRCQR